MQWNSSKNAGFSKSEPWIEINDNYKIINVENQINDEESIFNFYKKMIKLRRNSDVLIYGEYDLILKDDKNIYSYIRKLDNEKIIIITNLTNKKVEYIYENEVLKFENLLISNYKVSEHQSLKKLTLKPYEARMYKLD